MKIKKLATGLVLFSCVVGSASAHMNVGEWTISQCLSIKEQMIANKDIDLGMNEQHWQKWLKATEKSFLEGSIGVLGFSDYRDIVEQACRFVSVDEMLKN